jgi:hypothetical protein
VGQVGSRDAAQCNHQAVVSGAAVHLRGLARSVVSRAELRCPLRAALLAGSGGRGDADTYSDIDLVVYVDRVPDWDVIEQIRDDAGGTDGVRRESATVDFRSIQFDLDGVHTEVSFTTPARLESRLDDVLTKIEDFDSPAQKIVTGVLEGLALHGAPLVEIWKERVALYPEVLRRPMIARHWMFFPLWHYRDAMAARDAELWRLDMLLDAAFNLVAVLAALNRVYFTRFQFKRMRTVIEAMALAPADFASRLEGLFRVAADSAAVELAALIDETRQLVEGEFADMDLSLAFPLTSRQVPWRRMRVRAPAPRAALVARDKKPQS